MPDPRTLKLTITYDGTDFEGWQQQPNRRTVQGEIERALSQILGTKISVVGAGRTDAGVHALGQVASFSAETAIPRPRLLRGTNALLPKDVSVRRIEEAPPGWNAQFAARAKIYRYRILHDRILLPLERRFAWHVSYLLDVAAMQEGGRTLEGTHDFRAFAREWRPERSAVRTLHRVAVLRHGPIINVVVKGDGFLYNMVRSVVGTLVEVGRGRHRPADVREILSRGDRAAAGPTAPAQGLTLLRVLY